MRILLVKLSSMGDIVHALPVAASLRATFPAAQLAWAVERRWLPLVERHPALHAVFAIDSFQAREGLGGWPALVREIAAVRAFAPDWAIDLQGTVKAAVVTRLSGAPHRAGFGFESARESLSSIFYNARARPRSAHVVHELLDLAEVLGPLRRETEFTLPLAAEAEAAVATWLRREGIREFIFLSPGGGWGAKRWPEDRYATLAARLERRFGLTVVLNHGPGERQGVTWGRRFSGGVAELTALLRQARLVVGGDTGPLHLAAAQGRPVVALFGPTDPVRNGPFGPGHRVLRHAATATYKRGRTPSPALLAITVDEVETACAELLPTAQLAS